MKQLLKIFCTAIIAVALFGCERIPSYYSESFITNYIHLPLRLINHEGNSIGCCVFQAQASTYDENKYSIFSTGTDREFFDALCEKHGDTHYNRRVAGVIDYVTVSDHHAYWKDFVSLEVTSNADFDEKHPAGTSLNDIIIFTSVSIKEYIRSGYTMMYDHNLNIPIQQNATGNHVDFYYPIIKPADQLTPDDMVLIGHNGRHLFKLTFDVLPTINNEHVITVTLIADDGIVYKPSIKMVFE